MVQYLLLHLTKNEKIIHIFSLFSKLVTVYWNAQTSTSSLIGANDAYGCETLLSLLWRLPKAWILLHDRFFHCMQHLNLTTQTPNIRKLSFLILKYLLLPNCSEWMKLLYLVKHVPIISPRQLNAIYNPKCYIIRWNLCIKFGHTHVAIPKKFLIE